MRSPFKVLFFLKRDKQKTNGMIPLFCRIIVDGQEVRFGMKCDVNPKIWDVRASKATGRMAEAIQINALTRETKAYEQIPDILDFRDKDGNDTMQFEIEQNYNQIKLDVKQIVVDELKRISEDPALQHLIRKDKG